MSSDTHFQPVAGMTDLAEPEIRLWQQVEERARQVFALYRCTEIRTPIVEAEALFTRSLGDTTDVVRKEMYTFEDRGGRRLALRPEGTAGVLRALAGRGDAARSARLWYLGPMFRAERPQAGRRRQFHQLGVELLGAACPAADVECIALQQHLCSAWGLEGGRIEMNTRGLPEDRAAVAAGLRDALAPHHDRLCDDCRRRIDLNVLRVLDCKQAECNAVVATLPPVTRFMCQEARDYFDEVIRLLGRMGLPVHVNPRLVRGLDYYVHTVWEITHPALGAQDALAGGGRYRVEMDGRALEGVGFAVGLERVIAALRQTNAEAGEPARPTIWLVALGTRALEENLVLAQELRARGVVCGFAPEGGSLKAQLRAANKAGAAQVILRGDDELARGMVVLKDMAAGTQQDVAASEIVSRLAG